jgi:formylglycine-generating enzyme required for sulfatase activity
MTGSPLPIAIALAAAAAAGCGSDVLVGAQAGSTTTAAGGAGSPGAGGGSSSGGGVAGAGGRAGCPDLAGPTMVRVDDFCIDSTEVTNAQYAEFLAEAPPVETQPLYCYDGMWFNLSFEPSSGWPPEPGKENYPVVWVDWCDARMYCEWAGKRLCGRIGGGHAEYWPPSYKDASISQWYRACSAGTQAYPYGDDFEIGRCNDGWGGTGETAAVGSFPGCEGGYPGLFDMSGNVAEYEDACSDEPGEPKCRARGGTFNAIAADGTANRCDFVFVGADNEFVGLRCCWPP